MCNRLQIKPVLIYPNKFKPWELKSAPNNYWNNETTLEAIKWMIEEKLKWNDYIT